MKKNLIGLDRDELSSEITRLGEEPFRAKQLFNWLYNKGVIDFSQMSNFSKSLQEKLADNYTILRPAISKDQLSFDGTRKWLLKLDDGQEIETVYIPETTRGSLCLSSQIGCSLTCKFCHTGTQRLVRNLTAAEILGQIMLARDLLDDWHTAPDQRIISNIIMMGMGEPLLNYDNVAKALKLIMEQDGIALSKRKITLSTSGYVPMIEKCGEELKVNLAISLHAVRDDLRNELVPLNRKYPIKNLLDACIAYSRQVPSQRITFEYVMLKDVNDSISDAKELVRLLQGIPAKVNLIPFNPWPGTQYVCSSQEAIRNFAEIISKAGYASPVRTPRGQDILAACGQLRSESIRGSKNLTS
jgi:23S rRNA (adenine2503-C2)-methyltransferase